MSRGSGLALVIAAVATMAAAAPVRAQRVVTGSEVPCAVPMTWSIARIDPRFDLSDEWALQAVREAGALWEQATRTELFRFVEEGGFPIVFEFDDRQAGVESRREREQELSTERGAIERQRGELEASSRRYDALFGEYEREAADHDRAVRAYNNDMLRWSREREVPRSVQVELERQRDQLERTARDLRDKERELSRLSDSIRDEVESFNRRVEDLSDRDASLVRDFPASTNESGTYDETVSWRDDEPLSATRRIRVFQFASYDDLVLLLAHELGHALGLGHAPGPGAVMSEVVTSDAGVTTSASLTSVDTRLLSARCPGLVR